MKHTIDEQIVPLPVDESPRVKDVARPLWSRIALGAVLLLAIFMDFFQLGQNGYGNLYYAAGVRSMGDSWHNFFFVSQISIRAALPMVVRIALRQICLPQVLFFSWVHLIHSAFSAHLWVDRLPGFCRSPS
ncbi:MAG TPA: hypothetical protein VGM01_03270, partial [Ktedonobacteraceae bacterium]|jgi:4-amino-4-deoxy-L-arabinose transferase-like glycosyltransferase